MRAYGLGKQRSEVMKGVIDLKGKHAIIKLKEEGHSNRRVARLTGIHRKTVARYWDEHMDLMSALAMSGDNRSNQEALVSEPLYDSSSRGPRKYPAEIDALLDLILAGEAAKDAVLGGRHKQKLTNVQIHRMVRDAGHDIGITVLSGHIREKRARAKEAFIRQEYDYGARLEYDFGEVRLEIGNKVGKYYLAVLSSPAADFRWAYLYTNQKKDVFLDSHVRFFEMAGGCYEETVYDNMRNVVSRFIGKSEKQLNPDLIKMSIYYGFRINVTNCFSGNEKGFVEGSVKIIRNKAFACRYRFDTLADAEAYLIEELVKMNEGSTFDEEKKYLCSYRPPLELAEIFEQKVDKYSFVRVDNNFYSVPDYLVGRNVLIKKYATEIVVHSAGNKVCVHKKKEGFHEESVEIVHYLDTFMRKPGALRNSVALRSKTELKAVFDMHFTGRAREFIGILRENQDKELPEVINLLFAAKDPKCSAPTSTIEDNVLAKTASGLAALSALFSSEGGGRYAN
jgi:transposase